jgi:hypothetical protein
MAADAQAGHTGRDRAWIAEACALARRATQPYLEAELAEFGQEHIDDLRRLFRIRSPPQRVYTRASFQN